MRSARSLLRFRKTGLLLLVVFMIVGGSVLIAQGDVLGKKKHHVMATAFVSSGLLLVLAGSLVLLGLLVFLFIDKVENY